MKYYLCLSKIGPATAFTTRDDAERFKVSRLDDKHAEVVEVVTVDELSKLQEARDVWANRAADTATEMNNWRTRAQHAEGQRDDLKQQLEQAQADLVQMTEIRDHLLAEKQHWLSPDEAKSLRGIADFHNQDNQRLKAELERVCDEAKRLEADAACLREALGWAQGLFEHANKGAFDNGVKDQSGAIDEGDVIAGRIYEQMKQALTTTAGRSLLERLERYEKALKYIRDPLNAHKSMSIVAREALKGDK